MQAKIERFKKLAEEVAPVEQQRIALRMEMQILAREISVEIVKQSFPMAQVREVQAVSVIKPSHLGQDAEKAVKLLLENGITPSVIEVDTNLQIVTLLR